MANSLLLFSVMLLFFAGCASGPPIKGHRNAIPPEVTIGPELVLMEIPVKEEGGQVRAVMDDKGFAHVLAITGKSGNLYHLVVDEDGTIQKDFIKRVKVIGRLDLALDRQRNLHALVGGEHLLFKSGVWQSVPKDSCEFFGRGGKNLTCAYMLKEKEIDSPGRWDWDLIVEKGGCCIFPWYRHPRKMALLAETDSGWSRGIVIDATTELDIRAISISTDNEGTIHVVYGASSGGFLNWHKENMYLRIPSSVTKDKENHLRGWIKVQGQKIDSRLVQADIVVDPESGFLLIPIATSRGMYQIRCQTRLMMKDYMGPEIDFFIGREAGIYLYPAAEGQFHALVVGKKEGFSFSYFIYYFLFKQGVWSAPLELGQTNGWVSELVSDRFGQALILWLNDKNQLVARWIKTRN